MANPRTTVRNTNKNSKKNLMRHSRGNSYGR